MDTMQLCECGCSEPVIKVKNRYIYGHSNRGIHNPNYMVGRGRKTSKETRALMSSSRLAYWAVNDGYWLGKTFTEEHKKNIGLGGIGRIVSEKTRKKQSEARMGENHPMYGKSHTKETRALMSDKQKGENHPNWGKFCSEEVRQKIRIARTGTKSSEKTKNKISIATTMENNPNWLGGKSYELYGIEFNRVFREAVRKRDNYTCQMCGMHEDELIGFHKKHAVHHIDYDKKNNIFENAITLCIENGCHSKTNFNREYWESYFISLMKAEVV